MSFRQQWQTDIVIAGMDKCDFPGSERCGEKGNKLMIAHFSSSKMQTCGAVAQPELAEVKKT